MVRRVARLLGLLGSTTGCFSTSGWDDAADETARRAAAERAEAAAARALAHEAALQGTPVRGRGQRVDVYEGARWLQGRAEPGGLDVVVFWELWCPSCRTHLPELPRLQQRLADVGLEVAALTTLSRGTAEAKVRAHLAKEGLGVPVAVVPPRLSSTLNIRSIPHAVVLRDGEVLWQGSPRALRDDQLRAWARAD